MASIRRPVVRAVVSRIRDGSQVRVRPVRKEDASHAEAFFQWLSEETKYLRFMYPVKELTPQILEGALTQDGLQRVVLVAEPLEPTGNDPTPAVAIGRYTPAPEEG